MNKKDLPDASPREKKVKRVKTQHVRSTVNSVSPVASDCFKIEENENAEDSCIKFREACEELRGHFKAIYEAKKEKGNEAELQDHIADVCMLIMRLKKLNRLDKHQSKNSRDAVNEGKQKVDALNLQYQNLLYEVTHLQKEVTKCLEFRSKDEEIELVPLGEFYREAPPNISRPETTKADNHELTMARLQWELEQRKRFACKLKEAEVTKGEYIEKIKALKERLYTIQPTLQSILEATEPLQSKLGMPLQAMHLKHKIATFLPKPLYVLYVEASAYREACDKKMQISVEGNVDDAKVLQMDTEELSEDSAESDQEENADVNSHKHSISLRRSDSSKDVLNAHPMSVCIAIDAGGQKIILEFMYLFHLHIVTTTIKSISPMPVSSESVGDILKLDTILNCLFPGDKGTESPNPANKYQLRKAGYEQSVFSNETSGWPYVWSQHLAGLEFATSTNENSAEMRNPSRISSSFMEKTISAIRSRLVARLQLNHQIISLEQKTNIPPKFAALYPLNITSQLRKWSPVEFLELKSHPKYNELMELNVIHEDAMVFNAEIVRGSALLSVGVILLPDYPTKTPVFLMHLHWKGHHTSATSMALRELEEEVNIHFIEHFPKEFAPHLLLCQVYHLVACFDVFLETECAGDSMEGPREFVREKVVSRSARGRSHSRPYKCISSQGIFTYR